MPTALPAIEGTAVSWYQVAIVIAGLAALALAAVVLRAVVLVRRLGVLARAYRRQLAAESARLAHRRDELLVELAGRRRRTGRDAPRTMR